MNQSWVTPHIWIMSHVTWASAKKRAMSNQIWPKSVISHIWMSHESCRTYEWVMRHVTYMSEREKSRNVPAKCDLIQSHPTHEWAMNHVAHKSCHIHERAWKIAQCSRQMWPNSATWRSPKKSHESYDTYERIMSHVMSHQCMSYASCHSTNESWVMSHMTHMNESWVMSCHTNAWAMRHVTVRMSHESRVIWHIWTNHESCHDPPKCDLIQSHRTYK